MVIFHSYISLPEGIQDFSPLLRHEREDMIHKNGFAGEMETQTMQHLYPLVMTNIAMENDPKT